jgi:hypothetical protein
MIPLQLFMACALFFFGANLSGMQGAWCRILELPMAFAGVNSFWLAPVVVGMSFALPRRIPAWLRVSACDALAICIAVLTAIVFTHGAKAVTFVEPTPIDLSQELQRDLGFPVMVSGDHVWFSKTHDEAQLRGALLRHRIQIAP